MMINKRLIQSNPKSKKTIFMNVFSQWISLLTNIGIMLSLTSILSDLYFQKHIYWHIHITVILIGLLVRFLCALHSSKMSYQSSQEVKKVFRHQIYQKILALGPNYNKQINTSQIIQVASEGVEQLDTYFSAYLPQFFYSMIAPLTLFIVLSTIDWVSAIILFICVPLIPISIIVVQKWAKKLLSKYWDQYTELGDSFLENLQGLTTLKIYQSDAHKHDMMNQEAETFRKITMKVLTMQLNSITIMDLVAYGGAGIGIILACLQFQNGVISLQQALFIILLAADFFIPLRQLGSFFHIAMNGMAASDKMFALFDKKEFEQAKEKCPKNGAIQLKHVDFSYENKSVLFDINMEISRNQCISIVGESGSGKSTLVSLLMKRNRGYQGSILFGNKELQDISDVSLFETMTYVSNQAYLFKGSIRENLKMANEDATDEQMVDVLKQVKLYDFITSQQGLDTLILEQASNLSGGQRQRLALARALLKNSSIYIFDEATSNIDVESEEIIMDQIYRLSNTKTVILISHRLANVTRSDQIFVLKKGHLVEQGTHESLLENDGVYSKLWKTQSELEQIRKDGGQNEV